MKPTLVFGNKPQDIEGYAEAINSDELYIPHHRLEKDYTMKELQEMGRYDIVPPEELIWLPQSFHNGNLEIHKGLRECYEQMKCTKRQHSPEMLEKMFYTRYQNIVEQLNNSRDKRLNKIRFELIYNKPISRQAKSQNIMSIYNRIKRNKEKELREAAKLRSKEVAKFEKLLNKQSKLKKFGGKIWCYYEQKLQEMIEVL